MSSTLKLIPCLYGIPLSDAYTQIQMADKSAHTFTINVSGLVSYQALIAMEKWLEPCSVCSSALFIYLTGVLLHGLLVVTEVMLDKQRNVSVLTSTWNSWLWLESKMSLSNVMRMLWGVLGWNDTGVTGIFTLQLLIAYILVPLVHIVFQSFYPSALFYYSYYSGRILKQHFNPWNKACICPGGLTPEPACLCGKMFPDSSYQSTNPNLSRKSGAITI